ncbi:MAG: hypothetical protein JNN15_04615 [Blastocatellia bacterium]|nr:hypothetical protein [Blastocatellia bacterium]
MKKFLLHLWDKWKRIALVIGRFQTRVLLTLIYFLIIPFFSLIKLKDPLKKKDISGSMWQERFRAMPTEEAFKRMF